ncbi:MAG: DUF4139 domain-containing protein [Nannocystaceae bacterium]
MPVDAQLALDAVVLYRNGVGYFERHGEVNGDVLRIKVRKDQINDLLKSLTVVDRDGQALSVSMPLDPQSWASAALATLAPGHGSLAQALDAMRGTSVAVQSSRGRVRGRIVMVEETINEPIEGGSRGDKMATAPQVDTRDHRLTLLDGGKLRVVRLSEIRSVTLADGDLAMQLHRRLDASAGEGMFEQVDVNIRLAGGGSHDVKVSYVVEAPMWKPTYRVVLPDSGRGKALLQAWAVVDNVSGEDWNDVKLSLTSGAPISFRYDLHTPRGVDRVDLSESRVHRRARVAFGETSLADDAGLDAELEADADEEESAMFGEAPARGQRKRALAKKSVRAHRGPRSESSRGGSAGADSADSTDSPARPGPAAASAVREWDGPSVDFESLRRSTLAQSRAQQVSGLTRVDLKEPVTVPDGTSTMVAILNQEIEAEETFMFKPGGAGRGYDENPYRVVRFRNDTQHVLEPGPISIYARGSFVGEGLSEAVGTGASVTIPFAVEPEIRVTSTVSHRGDKMHITRIVRGVVEVESFRQTSTTWHVRAPSADQGRSVLVRHPRQGPNYSLQVRPEGTEDLVGAYLVPVHLVGGAGSADVTLVEQTPSRIRFTIWDGRVIALLDQLLSLSNIDRVSRGKLDEIASKRREIGRIDTEIAGLERQQGELDERADQMRQNLQAIKKDPRAGQLRARLSRRLESFTNDAAKLGRRVVELSSQRLERKIELDDLLEEFDFRAPAPK